jgi:hypothetical protein
VSRRSKLRHVHFNRPKKTSRPEHDAVFFPTPELPNLPDDTFRELFAAVGRDAEAKYQETRDQLLGLLTSSDVIQILAYLAHFFVLVKAPRHPKENNDHQIEQYNLELAQALALTSPLATNPPPGRLTDRVQQVIELLISNGEASVLRRFATMPSALGERRKAFVLEQIRAHTQIIRGAFYIDQGFRYLQLVLGRLDIAFSTRYGVTASAVLQVLRALCQVIEKRLNALAARQSRFFRHKKPADAVREFVRSFPEFGVSEDEVMTRFTSAGVRPDQMRHELVDLSCVMLAECFTLSHEDVALVCPVGTDASAVQRVIDQWALALNDLVSQNLDHIYLDNPVWRKPFIRLDDGRLFWPIPNISLTFGFEMFELLLERHKVLSVAYHHARAEMLEEELGTLLTKQFPGGKVMRRLEWTDPKGSIVYENDVVVAIDRTILIFEAKSRRITDSALRGSPDRLPVEIQKIMVEPAEQSKRLMTSLSTERRIHYFAWKAGPVEIDSRTIDTFVRMNVSFEAIGDLSSRWPELVEAQIIGKDDVQIPTMTLGELEIICRSLRNQATIVHYLQRRGDFERNAIYWGDELDLLALYLATGFNIGDAEFGETGLIIHGMSARLDEYFNPQQPGTPVLQPEAKRTSLWNAILSEIERRASEGWLAMTHRLLNVSYDDQVKVEKHMAVARRNLLRKSDPPAYAAMLGNGPLRRREGLAFITFGGMTREERLEFAREAAVSTMDKAGTNDCLVVGFNINDPPAPFHLITLIRRSA